ncbi:DEAD/DEAH box helicase [bacterium]|nr:DEAD/DEAH box helicase [bacterium]
MSDQGTTLPGFESLGLGTALLRAVDHLGYTEPTTIQEQTIAPMLAGQDILGQAQTGTGKTAAFALPLLNYLDPQLKAPQVLVLTPTRELAIQVADAFEQFSMFLKNVSILPVYGGANMRDQTRALKKGAQIIVGTPGRVMDHMRRETLRLDQISCIVLDEADEMLQMGFQEDVEWILERAPEKRQMALFSATISAGIRKIAKRFMQSPLEITVKTKTTTAATINQRYWLIKGMHKLDALSRILEVETTEGVIVFVRTRNATVELAEKLVGRGFNAAPLNGDIPQNQRERTVDNLKAGRINVLVATDVAARGLDVERISHVINYDIPHDAEAYIHRVGRTGRAGRTGEAIIFMSHRDKSMLRTIEKATRQGIGVYEMPKAEDLAQKRLEQLVGRLEGVVKSNDLSSYESMVHQLAATIKLDAETIAAAALHLLSAGQSPVKTMVESVETKPRRTNSAGDNGASRPRTRKDRPSEPERIDEYTMVQYRVEVGHAHGVKAGNLVGAITNEAGLDGKYVGKIIIEDQFSVVDLPDGMPEDVMDELGRVKVVGQPLKISINPVRHTASRGSRKPRDNRKPRDLQRRDGKVTRSPRKGK